MAQALACPPTPCSTCPFRRDTPPGIWHPSEYEKLPRYDSQAPELAVFHCHQQTATGQETVCKGWLSVFRFDAIAVRLAVAFGALTVEQVKAPCKVPLYGSGAEACAAGLSACRRPGERALRAIRRLNAKGIGVDAP